MISEEDKIRIANDAKKYAIKLVDESSYKGTPQFICYQTGAIHELELAQSRESILKEEIGLLKISFEQKCNLLTQADKYIHELEEDREQRIAKELNLEDEIERLKNQINDERSRGLYWLKNLQELEQKNKEIRETCTEYFEILPKVILSMGKDSESERCEVLKDKIEKLLKQ